MKTRVRMGTRVQFRVEPALFWRLLTPPRGAPPGRRGACPAHAWPRSREPGFGLEEGLSSSHLPTTSLLHTTNFEPFRSPPAQGAGLRLPRDLCTWQRDKVRSDHSRGDEPRASAGGTRILRVRFSRPVAASPSLSRAMPFLTLPGAALRPGGQSRGLQRRRPLPRGRCLPLPGGGGQRRGSPRSEWGRVTSPDASLSPDNSRRFEPDSHRSLILIFFFFFSQIFPSQDAGLLLLKSTQFPG